MHISFLSHTLSNYSSHQQHTLNAIHLLISTRTSLIVYIFQNFHSLLDIITQVFSPTFTKPSHNDYSPPGTLYTTSLLFILTNFMHVPHCHCSISNKKGVSQEYVKTGVSTHSGSCFVSSILNLPLYSTPFTLPVYFPYLRYSFSTLAVHLPLLPIIAPRYLNSSAIASLLLFIWLSFPGNDCNFILSYINYYLPSSTHFCNTYNTSKQR